jgi:midasin
MLLTSPRLDTAPPPGALPAYLHGAHLVLLDGLGLGVGLPPSTAAPLRAQCISFLESQLPQVRGYS